jgi:ABC-type branched-subunit amino acid transport system ATPase component
VRGLCKSIVGLRILDGVGFAIAPASVTAIIGPNGAGKTTLFNTISGFAKPDCGEVFFDGRAMVGKPPYLAARHGLVRTFQIPKALRSLTVRENLVLAGPDHPGERLPTALFRPRARRTRERCLRAQADEILDVFGLAAKSDDYAGTLSVGQRKLLEFARALMLEPRLMLLDEPMAGVNPRLAGELLDHMQELRRTREIAFLFIEHDLDAVSRHADRVLVLAQGRVIADEQPDLLAENPAVLDAYLGPEAAR